VRCGAHQRKALERLCRYITRPAIANERLSRNSKGQVVLQLKSANRDGTTHIMISPLEFMQCLAAVVPRPHQCRADRCKWRFAGSRCWPSVVPRPRCSTSHYADIRNKAIRQQ
jgi:hypothetical protein